MTVAPGVRYWQRNVRGMPKGTRSAAMMTSLQDAVGYLYLGHDDFNRCPRRTACNGCWP